MIYLGKTARHVREAKGMTQRATAAALDISYVHLSNIENNKSTPSPELLERYRRLWGIDLYILAWCLYGNANELPEPVRGPMRQLAQAWIKELGVIVPKDRRGNEDVVDPHDPSAR